MQEVKNMNTIGNRIKTKRKELGLTQAELGEKLHVTDRAVSKWEQNEGNPDISIIASLASVLNVSIDYLLTGKAPDEKIIIKSPKEILFETDDPQYLEKISVNDLSIVEMYNHKLVNTFGYLVDNNKIAAYVRSRSRYGGYNDNIPQITYLLLISNRLDKVKVFTFNDIGFWDDNEITDEMLNEFVSDERVNDETRDYVLTIHCRQLISINQGDGRNTETYHGYGNWQSLYPRILEKFAVVKRWDWVNRMLDLIADINKPGVKKYQANKNSSGYGDKPYLIFRAPSYRDYNGIRVIAVSDSVLNILLNEGQYDLLDKANSMNKELDQTTISQRTIDLHKMQNSNASLKEKLIFEFVQNGLLNYNGLLDRRVEIEGVDLREDKDKWLEAVLQTYGDLYHEIIRDNPISLIELTYKGVADEKLGAIFQFAVDYKIQPLIDALMDGDTENILSVAKNSFVYTEKKLENDRDGNYAFKETFYKIGEKWVKSRELKYTAGLINLPDLSEIPSKLSDAIMFFDKYKENVFNAWVKSIEDKIESRRKAKEDLENYNRIQSEITTDYLKNEIASGNIDNATIKACVKLESILRYHYKYEGDLSDMLTNYFNDHCKIIHLDRPWDDEDNSYYEKLAECDRQEELNKKHENWMKQLSKLRMKRNSLVHPDKTKIELTVDDLKSCVAIIAEIEG